MEISEAIRNRRSIRGFKPEPIPRKVMEEMLEDCRWTPSASNTQPWELAVLSGKVLEEFKDRLIEKVKVEWDTKNLKFRSINSDIPYPTLYEPYLKRAIELRGSIDSYQFPPGTPGLDEKRHSYLMYGGRLYGSPNAIIIYTDKAICPKAILDLGIMVQTIALAAFARGLGTCLMTMPIGWPEIVRDLLKIPESKLIGLAIAIGYPDMKAKVNSFKRTREPLSAFTHWYGD